MRFGLGDGQLQERLLEMNETPSRHPSILCFPFPPSLHESGPGNGFLTATVLNVWNRLRVVYRPDVFRNPSEPRPTERHSDDPYTVVMRIATVSSSSY